MGVCVATGGVYGVGWRGDGGAEEGWVCSVEEPPVVAWLAVAASLFPLASLFLLFLSSLCIGCNLSSVVAWDSVERSLVRNRLVVVDDAFHARTLCKNDC